MLSRSCKGNEKAFLSPKIELTFLQGIFRPKINCYWSLYFHAFSFFLQRLLKGEKYLINGKIRVLAVN